MVDEALAKELLWILQSSGAGFAEVFSQNALSATASAEPSGEMAFTNDSDEGVSLYVEMGDRSFFSALGPAPAGALRDEARRLANGEPARPEGPSSSVAASACMDNHSPSFGEWDVKRALDEARNGALNSDPRVIGVSTICKEAVSNTLRLDSSGGLNRRSEHTWTAYVQALARESDVTRWGARILGETAKPSGGAVGDLAAEAARAACLLLEACPAPAGEFPVVLSPQAAGLFLHETLGRALEGDLVTRHMSFLSNGRGRQIASSALTVGEEPPPGTHYDDEGTKLRKATLVENGVLISFLSGRKTSALLGAPNCGAAWRGSYRSLPSPLLRHMRVATGKASLQEMLSKMELGLYVTRLGGGTFDAASGSFSFPAAEGFVVREGTLGEPVKPAEISGNAAETLRRISVVGSKCERHPGMARKRNEAIMIWDFSPAVAFESMLVKPTNSPMEISAAFR